MYDELTAEREKSISINMPGLMKDVYAWMAIALVVTGFSAWFVADNALLRGLFMGSRTGTWCSSWPPLPWYGVCPLPWGKCL